MSPRNSVRRTFVQIEYIYLMHTHTVHSHSVSYLNKEGKEQIAAGTWQHHHRHLLQRDGGGHTHTWRVNISQKTSWLSLEAEERGSDKGGRLTTDPSHWELRCRVTSDRQPHFTSDLAQIWNRWIGCMLHTHRQHTPLLFPPFFLYGITPASSPPWLVFHSPHLFPPPSHPPQPALSPWQAGLLWMTRIQLRAAMQGRWTAVRWEER